MPGVKPSDYSRAERIAALTIICERIANSSNGLAKICRSDKTLPDVGSVLRWIDQDEREGSHELRDMYARAKEAQADYMADEIVDISDDGSRDYVIGEDGKEVADHDHIQRSRLRVDARKWVAAKLKPRKYGDAVKIGGDPDNQTPINVSVSMPDIGSLLSKVSG